ncbi:MAG: sodium:solute symporter [Ignavibacteria bacterium]|nr:sodium:solute symporter [Ignavibacteria bacterium]MBK7158881.1 sodium:solute symporter [Ignavibacteria bacterium]
MSPFFIITLILLYFSILLSISWYTGRNATSQSYYLGNKKSPWFLVAFGLIGDSLSGVTFISIPGAVAKDQFSYMQIVLGYLIGYIVIAKVLLPLYYKLNLTSIYSFLGQRLGTSSEKTGSFFFLLSRLIGAAFRLYISAAVLQIFIFDQWGMPFAVTSTIVIGLILLYTYRGGIRTLVWTDSVQSLFLLAGVIFSIIAICNTLDLGLSDIFSTIQNSKYSQVFFWNWQEKNFFFKQFLSGVFIAIVMTGLDQNMMQKNLSCKSLPDAQKNIYVYSSIAVFVNLFFVMLGALLYIYADAKGISIPAKTDELFPLLALNYLGSFAAVVFILGITAATFSSADSVLTTLTTSFCIDFLKVNSSNENAKEKKIRHIVHIAFAVLLLLIIILFREINNDAVINTVFRVAGYTYGPLLGLFAFGLYTKISVKDKFVPVVCILAPLLSYLLDTNSVKLFNGYKFGFEILLLNGLITFAGLLLLKKNLK